MTPRQYSSFEEIDKQLEILRLKRAIHKEGITFNYNKLKVSLYPKNIVLEISYTLKEKLIAFIVGRYRHFF